MSVFSAFVNALQGRTFDQVCVNGTEYAIEHISKRGASGVIIVQSPTAAWTIPENDPRCSAHSLLRQIAGSIGQRGSFVYSRNLAKYCTEIKQQGSEAKTVYEKLNISSNIRELLERLDQDAYALESRECFEVKGCQLESMKAMLSACMQSMYGVLQNLMADEDVTRSGLVDAFGPEHAERMPVSVCAGPVE